MLKGFLSIFLLMSLIACGKGGGGGDNAGSDVALNEVSTDAAVPTAALNFDVKLQMKKFSGSQEAKVLEAAELIKRVVASDEFKNKILNHRYNGRKTFVDNGGLTNAQIYKKILEGAEMLKPGKNNTMDLQLELYTANNIVVGYTMPNVIKIWMNSKFLNQNNSAEVTTNMMHEWLHKLGFKHAAKQTPNRKYSVPYAIGYLTRNIARKMI